MTLRIGIPHRPSSGGHSCPTDPDIGRPSKVAGRSDSSVSMTTKHQDLERIREALHESATFADECSLVGEGDSLALLRKMPDHCVSLILTDPPYHTTKKANIYGDTHFAEDQRFLEWMEQYAEQWRRVLRPNGSLYCFCSSEMAARLEVMLSSRFNVLSHVVWTKPNDPGFDGWKG